MDGGLSFDGVELGGRAWKGGSGRLVVTSGSLQGDAVGGSHEGAVAGGGGGGPALVQTPHFSSLPARMSWMIEM